MGTFTVSRAGERGSRTIADVYRPSENSLNFIRLLLAATVIIWHAFPLTGHDIGFAPLRQFMANVPVDGFFALSGFLIVGSWVRRPHVGRYLQARILRIMPAFWVCLLVTAFLLAPATVGWAISGSNVSYVFDNAFLLMRQSSIEGTLQDIPFDGTWNGSMWTLAWEFACYLAVLTVGVIGILKWRHSIAMMFAGALAVAVAVPVLEIDNNYVVLASRFALMFLAGMVVWRYQASIPIGRAVIGVALVAVVVSLLLPNYRVLAALPLAYLLLVAGAVFRRPRLRNDISYGVYVYAFPVQQMLAVAGIRDVVWSAVLGIVCTVPLAAASWFLVERPAMSLLKRRRRAPAPAAPEGVAA